MKSIAVSFERTDQIRFLLDDDPHFTWIRTFDSSEYQRLFVYIDANVKKIWGHALAQALEAHGKEMFWLEIEPVESSKSLSFYPTAVAFLEEHGAGRFDLVVAIGGGIVLDLVSFLVSTYMRGLPFYAIPTTLIGQMDATTAGKTCLNTVSAKNVLGTFYYPRVVYNNTEFLTTSSAYYMRQGYSEVFKYGLLGCPELIQLLAAHHNTPSRSLIVELIRLAIETRVSIRKLDPLASNLGHTFGHALEKLSRFEMLHGDAISAGTVMALHYAQGKGLIAETSVRSIVEEMKQLNLNVYFDQSISAEEMTRLMLRDKKSSSDTLHLVLIRDVGEPYHSAGSYFYSTAPADVQVFLEGYLATSAYRMADCASFLKRDDLYAATSRS